MNSTNLEIEKKYFDIKYVSMELAESYKNAYSKKLITQDTIDNCLEAELINAIKQFREGRKTSFPNKTYKKTLIDRIFVPQRIHLIAGYLERTGKILYQDDFLFGATLFKKVLKSERESYAFDRAREVWNEYHKST